jgi:hypothetical protein
MPKTSSEWRCGPCVFVGKEPINLPGHLHNCYRIFVQHDNVPGWNLGITFDRDGNVFGFEVRAPFDLEAPNFIALPMGGLTRRKLQAIPLGQVEMCARYFARWSALGEAEELAVMGTGVVDGVEVGKFPLHPDAGPQSEAHLRALADAAAIKQHSETKKPGRAHISTHDVVIAAAMFAELVAHGERAPYVKIGKQIGLPTQKVATRVRIARQRGYLTPAAPAWTGEKRGGVARGELTDPGLRELAVILNTNQETS